MSDTKLTWALIAACIAVLVALALFPGCATGRDVARGVVSSGGIALAAADREAAVEYSRAAREALEESATLEEYEEAMRTWNGLEDVLRTTRLVLEACEDAVDAWDAGGAGDWPSLARELLSGFERIALLLAQLGVPVPEAVLNVLELASQLGGDR